MNVLIVHSDDNDSVKMMSMKIIMSYSPVVLQLYQYQPFGTKT